MEEAAELVIEGVAAMEEATEEEAELVMEVEAGVRIDSSED